MQKSNIQDTIISKRQFINRFVHYLMTTFNTIDLAQSHRSLRKPLDIDQLLTALKLSSYQTGVNSSNGCPCCWIQTLTAWLPLNVKPRVTECEANEWSNELQNIYCNTHQKNSIKKKILIKRAISLVTDWIDSWFIL